MAFAHLVDVHVHHHPPLIQLYCITSPVDQVYTHIRCYRFFGASSPGVTLFALFVGKACVLGHSIPRVNSILAHHLRQWHPKQSASHSRFSAPSYTDRSQGRAAEDQQNGLNLIALEGASPTCRAGNNREKKKLSKLQSSNQGK